MKKALTIWAVTMLIVTGCFINKATATTYIIWGTYVSPYAQSETESSAHLVRFSKGMYNNGNHPWCGDRAYILIADKELYATVLAASLMGKPVNVIYEDNAPKETAAGHVCFPCKVLSIWWD